MRTTLLRCTLLSVMEVMRIPNAMHRRDSFSAPLAKHEFVDASTWEQIIGVLEEISQWSVATTPRQKPATESRDMSEIEAA